MKEFRFVFGLPLALLILSGAFPMPDIFPSKDEWDWTDERRCFSRMETIEGIKQKYGNQQGKHECLKVRERVLAESPEKYAKLEEQGKKDYAYKIKQ